MSNHELLISFFQTYLTENEKWTEVQNKSAATRARKALSEIGKLVKERRQEIQNEKNSNK
jgi:hypothetical protein